MVSTTPNNPNQEISKPMTANQELENCLTKAIDAFKVRDMLTRFGIPEDVEVTLEMRSGDNPASIAKCSVPTTVKKDRVPCGSMSLINLQDSLIDDFINPAISTFDLSTLIPDENRLIANGQDKLTIDLSCKNSSSSLNLSIAPCCCCTRIVDGRRRCCRFCPCR